MALWPSTTYQPHRKPTTANQNLTIPNPHHGTVTNTTREKTQTLQCWSTPKPTNHHLHTRWRRLKDHERERERRERLQRRSTPKSTRHLGPSGSKSGFRVLREWESDREESDFQWVGLGYGVLWWCWLRFTMEALLRWDRWDRRGKRVIFSEEGWWLRRLRLRLIEDRVMEARPWLVFGFWRKLQIGKTQKGDLRVGEKKKRKKKKLFNKMVHRWC